MGVGGVLAVRGGRLARITLRGFGDAVPMANDAVLVGVLLESTACSDAMVLHHLLLCCMSPRPAPCRFCLSAYLFRCFIVYCSMPAPIPYLLPPFSPYLHVRLKF